MYLDNNGHENNQHVLALAWERGCLYLLVSVRVSNLYLNFTC